VRLVLVGPPGAGKGTQAERLAQRLDVPHISTGDLFRANLKEMTPLGVEAKRYMDAGNLVPDEVTSNMVRARLAEPDAAKGFILDGFPRTLPQADTLDIMLDELGVNLDAVVEFAVADEVVVQRLLGRGRRDRTAARALPRQARERRRGRHGGGDHRSPRGRAAEPVSPLVR
jgi:adenylate kinase